MKLIDQTSTNNKGRRRFEAMVGSLGLRRSQQSDMEAQETIIAFLQKVLDNRYILLRNIVIVGLDIPIPLVLVGPAGVRVLVISGVRGIYRVRDDIWEQLDEGIQNYRRAQPNLVTRTLLLGQAVEAYLIKNGRKIEGLEALLLFSDPGMHVDSIHPAVRVVLIDGLERLVSGLVQEQRSLTPEQVQVLASLLTGRSELAAQGQGVGAEPDSFSFTDERQKSKRALPGFMKVPNDKNALRVMQNVPFNNFQWLVLIGFIFVDICLLVVLVIVLLQLK